MLLVSEILYLQVIELPLSTLAENVADAPAAISSFVAASPHTSSPKLYSTLKNPEIFERELSIVSVDAFELPLHAPRTTDAVGSSNGQSAAIDNAVEFGPVVT